MGYMVKASAVSWGIHVSVTIRQVGLSLDSCMYEGQNHTSCLKKHPTLTYYNLDIHDPIMIMFGTLADVLLKK